MADIWTEATALGVVAATIVAACGLRLVRRQDKRMTSASLEIVAVDDPSGDARNFRFPVDVVNAGGVGTAGITVALMANGVQIGVGGPFSIAAGKLEVWGVQTNVPDPPLERLPDQSTYAYIGAGELTAELRDRDGVVRHTYSMGHKA